MHLDARTKKLLPKMAFKTTNVSRLNNYSSRQNDLFKE